MAAVSSKARAHTVQLCDWASEAPSLLPRLPASFVREQVQSHWPGLGSVPDATTHLLGELEREPSPLCTSFPFPVRLGGDGRTPFSRRLSSAWKALSTAPNTQRTPLSDSRDNNNVLMLC